MLGVLTRQWLDQQRGTSELQWLQRVLAYLQKRNQAARRARRQGPQPQPRQRKKPKPTKPKKRKTAAKKQI